MPKTFSYSPQLRWSDQDLNGHINNARILTLLEDSRIAFMMQATNDAMRGLKVVGRIEIDYRRPVMWGTELIIESWIGRIGNTSYVVRSRATQDGVVVFETRVVLVAVDREGRPRQLRDVDRAFLAEYLDPEDPD